MTFYRLVIIVNKFLILFHLIEFLMYEDNRIYNEHEHSTALRLYSYE